MDESSAAAFRRMSSFTILMRSWNNYCYCHSIYFTPFDFIFDRAKEISLVPNKSTSVRSISLQPESNANIFAAVCYDRTVRIFDTRNTGNDGI